MFPSNGIRKNTESQLAKTGERSPALSKPQPPALRPKQKKAPARPIGWRAGAKHAVKRFLYIAAVILTWTIIVQLDLVSPSVAANITLCLSVLAFILSMPVSIFVRMDTFFMESSNDPEIILLYSLPFLLINFVLIGAIRGFLRGAAHQQEVEKQPGRVAAS